MSITETKFRKGYVETPILKTDNIEYMGLDYPIYDAVTYDFIPSLIDFEEEFAVASSYTSVSTEVIRILPHTPLVKNIGLMTLRGISLHTSRRQGELEYIVLCVYGKRGNSYDFVGHSINAFVNPLVETTIDFQFDVNLFELVDDVYTPYREVYLRPLKVTLDEVGDFVIDESEKNWDYTGNRATLSLKSCNSGSINYNPYITTMDGSASPHVIFKYRTGNFSVNDKIPHNANGNVHVTQFEKEKVEELSNLTTRIFAEDDIIETSTVVDTRMLNTLFDRRGGEIMCAFTINPRDYIDHEMTELRFRRGDNLKYLITNKYLQADCYDELGNIIFTKFSDEPKSQEGGSNYEIVFNFSDFVMKREYKSIEFRISETNTTRQTNYLSFSGSSLRNSNNAGYCAKSGWILKWIDGAHESGSNPSTQNNLTSDFTIIFSKNTHIKGSGFIKHVSKTDIHVTNEEKETWNNKIDETILEATLEERLKDYDALLQEGVIKETTRNTKDIFAKDGTGTAARVHAWDMKTAEYVGEYLTQVTIYRPTGTAYIEDSDILHNNPQWLSVECLDADGNLLDTYFSNDKDSQKDGEDNTTTWNFDDIKIKEEYSKLRFRVSTEEGVLEKQPQNMTRAILCYTYNNIPDTIDWGVILQDNVGEPRHTMYFQFKTVTKQNGLLGHVDNKDIHVTLEDKERWDNIEIPDVEHYTAGNGIDITDDAISVITTDVMEESDKIPTSKAVYNEIYDTQVFKNWDRTKHTVGQDTVGTIIFGRKHFISGIVSKITIPHDNKTGDGAGQNGYLAIQVFDEKLDENNQSVLEQVAIYYSTEEEQYNTSKGKCEFLFNNVVIPENYKQVHLTVVENKTIVPSPTSSGNRQIRLHCLAKYDDKNETVVYEEDDECYVYWKTNTDGTSAGGANYVAVVEVECKKPCYDVVNEKIEKITDYKSNISSIVYATTDFLPSGTVEQEDSVQKMQIILSDDVKSDYYKNNKLTKVSIHRHNTNGTYNIKYYLQIRAWDKNTNELYKFTSVDKHAQGEGKVVSWYFDDVYFGENLKDVIVIGFLGSKDATDFVGGTPIRVGTWNINGSRWYLNEWAVSWNNTWQNRTPHVSLEFESSNTTINNKFTSLETAINSHVGDDTHVTADEKLQIAKVSSIQSNVEELETKYNNVTTILNNSLPDIDTFSTLDSGTYVIKAGGKTNATGVQLSREHFTTGSIKMVQIYHADGINVNDIRLCAIVFNHGEDENTPKTIDDCIFSTNPQSQIQGAGGCMCFRFNNLELPDDYEFVRFLFAKGDTVIPAHNDSNTVLEARIQILAPKEQSSEGEYAEAPDDECKTLHISGTSNWYPHVRAVKTVLGYSDIVSLINRVSQLEARISELEKS